MSSSSKPHLLVVSHFLPFPRSAGQRQRVYYSLKAAQRRFHVTFAVTALSSEKELIERQLADLCDEVVILPPCYSRSPLRKIWYRAAATGYGLRTGLKFSNYVLSKIELTPQRVVQLFKDRRYDCALFEYWHAWRAAAAVKSLGVPILLDTHNVLWQAYQRDLATESCTPRWWQRRAVSQYRRQEERAWSVFDGVIAINRDEFQVIRRTVASGTAVFYTPMGIDLTQWPYSWQPGGAVRMAYYGGLGSPHNQRDALYCAREVMPHIWKQIPAAELWLIGSNPPEKLRALAVDPRIRVTGFIENVQALLPQMSLVMCPWTGTYGFRSRLVELLALGVPVIASPDAIAGMDFVDGESVLLAADTASMAQQCLTLLNDPLPARRQSQLGRIAVEKHYNNDDTYGSLIDEICTWLEKRKRLAFDVPCKERPRLNVRQPALDC